MIEQHLDHRAGVTVASIPVSRQDAKEFGIVGVGSDGRTIEKFVEKPTNPPTIPDSPDESFASMGIYVFDTRVLVDVLHADAADSSSRHDMGGNIVPALVNVFWQEVLVSQMGIFVLLAVGLNLVVGWAGLLDLGFIAFFAVGAYSASYWTGHLPVAPPVTLNAFEAVPLSVVTCLLAGVLLGGPTLRLRGDYLAIVTLGFHEIVYLVAKNADGFTGGSRGVIGIPHFGVHVGPVNYDWTLDPLPYWYLVLFFLVVLVVVFGRLEHSRVGRIWTAIREDEVAAAASGIDTVRYKLLAFAIGASTSGLAGVVYSSKVGFISPENFPLVMSVLVLAYVVFGGMGSIPGVVAGAALLVWLPNFLRDYVKDTDRYMYLGGLLVVMMIYRPQGVIPSRRRQRELRLAEEGVGDADAMSEPAGGVGA